jgi:hypothetical protein
MRIGFQDPPPFNWNVAASNRTIGAAISSDRFVLEMAWSADRC